MIPLLIGGVLICLIGYVMVLAAAFAAGTAWGVLCLLPPVGWLFAAFNWQKTWDGVMLQGLGLAMAGTFFLQIGGFDGALMAEAWTKFQREQGLVVVPSGKETAVLSDQPVQAATPATADGGAVQSIITEDAAAVTVQGAAKVEVDDKPVYRCIDPEGKETFSREPCPMGVKKTP